MEADGLCRPETCSELAPALRQPPVVDHDKISGALQARKGGSVSVRCLRLRVSGQTHEKSRHDELETFTLNRRGDEDTSS